MLLKCASCYVDARYKWESCLGSETDLEGHVSLDSALTDALENPDW